MKLDIICKQDLDDLKNEIVQSIASINMAVIPRKWLRSKEVREMLGISAGTLQNMRINGHIKFSKIGGTLFYDYEDLVEVLNESKTVNIKDRILAIDEVHRTHSK